MYCLVLSIFLLGSCTNEKKEYHENGRLKKSYTLKNGQLQGPYREYDNSGQLREAHEYENGKKMDSSVYYLPNSLISVLRYTENPDSTFQILNYHDINILKKGYIDSDSLKHGTWRTYEDGYSTGQAEYYAVENKPYLNQTVRLSKEGDTLRDRSKFMDMHFAKDTIGVGETFKAAIYLMEEVFKGYNSETFVCLPKEPLPSFKISWPALQEIPCDTFYNLNRDTINQKAFDSRLDYKKITVFGKSYDSPGEKMVRGWLVEERKPRPSDPDSLKTEKNYTFFEKRIFVKDEGER